MKRCWVVPYLPGDHLAACLDSISEHYPGDRIVAADMTGRNYATDAWCDGLDTDADFFCLIQDSLTCNQPYEFDGLQVLRWFDERHGHDAKMEQFIRDNCERMGIDPGDTEDGIFYGVFGPILFTPRVELEQLEQLGVLDIKPADKVEASAMERIVGLALTHLGVDFTANPIQGRHTHPDDSFEDPHFTKVFLNRG